MVFLVFLFCCLSRKAVFDMAGREGKFTWNLWLTDWKRMSITHKQQKRVFMVFFSIPLTTETSIRLFLRRGISPIKLCDKNAVALRLRRRCVGVETAFRGDWYGISVKTPSDWGFVIEFQNDSYESQEREKHQKSGFMHPFWGFLEQNCDVFCPFLK